MKLTIDRQIWLRGEGHDDSFLLRPSDGRRCCVGIYLSALGVPDDQLAGLAAPVVDAGMSTSRLRVPAPGWLWQIIPGDRYEHSADALCLYDANDPPDEAEEFRERRITEIFARHGVEVEFVG